jgi:hypothetical protein
MQQKEAVFTIETLLGLSKGVAPYQWMCTTFIGCVVGSKAWNKKRFKERISKISTCSDEAFLLLTLENNYQRWLAEAAWIRSNKNKAPQDREPKNFPVAKYTNSGKSKRDGRSRRLHGWAREGYLRFNELYQLVAKDRSRRTRFEEELLQNFRDKMRAAPALPGITEDDQDDVYPENDLFGVAEGASVADQSSNDEEFGADGDNSNCDEN